MLKITISSVHFWEGEREVVERITGTLKSFSTEKGLAHGYVRLKSGGVVHVAARERRVLNADGTLSECVNGERYYAIASETPIVLDVEHMGEGKSPFVVAWAPKVCGSKGGA